jgi:hypothetical protein
MKISTGVVCFLLAGFLPGVIGCSDETNPRVASKLNQDAAVTGDLPSNPLQGRLITSWINRQDGTMSTLFGNDVAVQYARTSAEKMYPAGSVLSVVTWGQQEDPRWFGAKIPEKTRSVEMVTVTAPGAYSYQRYEGSPLKKVEAAGLDGQDAGVKRGAYLLAQRAAVMP